ncbi:MAG TPA: bifunctional pyr operon transcriptional regulator/uracil phosphoribosyltransferase PyrR [Spirochaetota bacterium]|nr:bifunctional pyr operon transcriptional regulator/uracil phosphoribosyltransferase PyrR [Spirochaetota bacterium]
MASEKTILSSSDIERIISETAEQVVRDFHDMDNFAIVGIQTRGVELAARIREHIEKITGKHVKNGILDITFYRDDITTRGKLPVLKETLIEFNINNKAILLVDDVLFTGRTTKAAIETLMAFGRPHMIRLFVLVDRGGRELPIQADYCGYRVLTAADDLVKVRLKDTDKVEDSVVLVTER